MQGDINGLRNENIGRIHSRAMSHETSRGSFVSLSTFKEINETGNIDTENDNC